MVSTRRKKAAVSAEFIEDSDESDGNETYQDEDLSDGCGGGDNDDKDDEEAEMSEPEPVEVPSTPRKRGRPRKAPATPTPAKGKKRAIDEVAASDSDGSFIASPIHNSPKKPRVAPSMTKKPLATPSKSMLAKAATKSKAASPTKLKTALAAANSKSTSPSKAALAKKSKVAAVNKDNDQLEQESVVSDDDPSCYLMVTYVVGFSELGNESPTSAGKKNETRQLIFDASVLKAKGSVETSKKKNASQDVFKNDVTMSDDEIMDNIYPKQSKCHVSAPELVDPFLKDSYKKLTKLPGQVINRGLKFISWKDNNDQEDEYGNGMILFSSIKDVHPDIDLKYVKGLVTFEKDYGLNVINLSRIDPSLLISKKTASQTKGGPMVFIRDHKTPALCVTLGIIADDQTVSPCQRGDKEVKFITAKLLAYEYERMVAVLCMVHGKVSVRVQLADSTLTFAMCSAEPNSGSSPIKGFATVRSHATMTNKTPDRKFRYTSLGPRDLGKKITQIVTSVTHLDQAIS
ncbi:hypothetical protein K443DRAFT_126525 [Laccaria amethystina LaAM-08-1]|uniref:Uncharacterized protein n=1 Tax=Laccaria amethystina LaAM-08-1 TaxID=1095629 RepID=A0A0C9WGZ9_9AGAR|nr:hypothetical protein K443DRAFT_126525 [Laccaria amethystina LaAM-08-1]